MRIIDQIYAKAAECKLRTPYLKLERVEVGAETIKEIQEDIEHMMGQVQVSIDWNSRVIIHGVLVVPVQQLGTRRMDFIYTATGLWTSIGEWRGI